MISVDTEVDIRFLLEEGYSHREIARRTGVSKTLVTNIAKYPKIRVRKQCAIKLKKKCRCNICGGLLTIWPCLACHPEIGYYKK